MATYSLLLRYLRLADKIVCFTYLVSYVVRQKPKNIEFTIVLNSKKKRKNYKESTGLIIETLKESICDVNDRWFFVDQLSRSHVYTKKPDIKTNVFDSKGLEQEIDKIP